MILEITDNIDDAIGTIKAGIRFNRDIFLNDIRLDFKCYNRKNPHESLLSNGYNLLEFFDIVDGKEICKYHVRLEKRIDSKNRF